jgi:hypothetical protein
MLVVRSPRRPPQWLYVYVYMQTNLHTGTYKDREKAEEKRMWQSATIHAYAYTHTHTHTHTQTHTHTDTTHTHTHKGWFFRTIPQTDVFVVTHKWNVRSKFRTFLQYNILSILTLQASSRRDDLFWGRYNVALEAHLAGAICLMPSGWM